jgi:SNF2 family DNA or RNA helicase
VTVLRLIARGTIEDKILHIQEAKRELAEEILSGETGTLGRLSREELLDLLQ